MEGSFGFQNGLGLTVKAAYYTKAPFRLGARSLARCSGTKMDVVQIRQYIDPFRDMKKNQK